MSISNNAFTCFTVENLKKAISAGLYDVVIDHSHRLNYNTPHIKVPNRDKAAGGDAGIRIHPANLPKQLLGCIAVGDHEEPNAVGDSKKTFSALMNIIQKEKGLKINVVDIPTKVT
jgi:hypothetical protein